MCRYTSPRTAIFYGWSCEHNSKGRNCTEGNQCTRGLICDQRQVASADDGREVTAAAAAAAALEAGGSSCTVRQCYRRAGVTHTCVRSHGISFLVCLASRIRLDELRVARRTSTMCRCRRRVQVTCRAITWWILTSLVCRATSSVPDQLLGR